MPHSDQTLTLKQYQQQAFTTALYPEKGTGTWGALSYAVLGLQGETGEVAEKVKKIWRDDGGVISAAKRLEIEAELGDVLWYLGGVCTELGLDLGEVAEKNLEKLASRKDRGVLHGNGDHR